MMIDVVIQIREGIRLANDMHRKAGKRVSCSLKSIVKRGFEVVLSDQLQQHFRLDVGDEISVLTAVS